MKHFLCAIVMILIVTSTALAADVGVSVSVAQPGFYGRIDVGSFPQPELIYARPVVVHPVPVGVVYQPVYMHVPPGHAKHWSKHCSKYNACGHPVYFVKDNWYNDVYVPHQQARNAQYAKQHGDKHGEKQDKGNKNGKHGHGKGHD
jgi:hypothetical protein